MCNLMNTHGITMKSTYMYTHTFFLCPSPWTPLGYPCQLYTSHRYDCSRYILATLIHHTQPDQQHSSKFLPYIIYTLDKKENEVRMSTLPKQLHRKHSSLSTAVFYFLFMNACTYGDLGDSGTLGKTIHKLKWIKHTLLYVCTYLVYSNRTIMMILICFHCKNRLSMPLV